jgi:predicted kinase
MIDLGRTLLAQDGGVVLDATFRRNSDRADAREMALKSGAEWRVIECVLPPEMVRERLERRTKIKEGLSDATRETYLRQRLEFEPFDDRDRPRLELDTSADIGVLAHRATDWLRGRDQ